jgi:ubiquinone/menaquinone biosynthesis C-methylase UbiE
MGRLVPGHEEYKRRLKKYYDEKAPAYDTTYTGIGRYPTARFRLLTALRLLEDIAPRPKRILDAGCGNARVLLELLKRGFTCVGFDASEKMLEEARHNLVMNQYDPQLVRQGDIYKIPFADRSFDLVLCLGVLSNLTDHDRVFAQFRRVLKDEGRVIVSMNNELFSLFSLNEYTVSFLDELYQDIKLPKEIRNVALSQCKDWFHLQEVSRIKKVMQDSEIDKRGITIPKYNPLNVEGILHAHGFAMEAVRFYHYHPLPPRFETMYPELFMEFAEKLETVFYDWRGAILCNGMIIVARLENPQCVP